MSGSFPIIYNSQNNSNIIKYYQSGSETNIVLENDILLKNMVQKNTSETISNLDGQMYTESNVVVENTNFSQNLSITDVNCCLSNPTSFCIGSNFIQQPPADNQSYTINTGSNVFKSEANTISAVIQLDANNSPIFDTDLLITITDGIQLFNSVNGIWSALFEENDNILLQKAVNSGLNNQTNQSLLTIGEDINFNNNYALGNNQSSYYIQDTTTKQLIPSQISEPYLPSTNNINISVDLSKLTHLGLGSYKIYQLESDISISSSNNVISDHYIIGNDNDNDNNKILSNINSLSYYLTLFNDTSENNFFKIEINEIDSNSGLNFTDSENNTYFTLDNTTMEDNLLFMENIVYPNYLNPENAKISLEITQNDMTITPNEITDAYTTNNSYFTLTSNGEMLDVTDYNQNGNIQLQIASKTDRTTVISETPSVFTQKIVDYNNISEELKTNQNVSYTVTNIISPTGEGQYNSFTDNNGTSLYTTEIPFSTISLSSSLSSEDDEVIFIKISPLTILTNLEGNNVLYILDDITDNPDTPINAEISVQISGNTTLLKQNNDLRLNVYPKTLTQLNLSSLGDENGDNNLITIEESLTTLNTNPTNGWLIGYSDSSTYVKSALSVFTSLNTFPAIDDYEFICDNNSSLQVQISYIINTFNFEQFTISYNSKNLSVSGVNIISNTNKEEISTTYEYITVISSSQTSASRNYHQIKVTKITTYNALFQLNLSGFNNINMMTPKIYSTTISYIYYPTVSNLQNTTVNIGRGGTVITVTQTNGALVSPSSFVISTFPTVTTVYLNGLNDERNKEITTTITITKATITPLDAIIQYRTKTSPTTYTSWTNTGPVIQNIEPFFNTSSIITINSSPNYTITTNIFPSIINNELIFDLPEYFTPLILNNFNTTTLASGFKYQIIDLPEEMLTNFDPNSYINNNLIISNNALNLSTTIIYSEQDATEGNATYNATMTIKNNDTEQIIATIDITNPDFTSPIVLVKINRNLFSVIKTINTSEVSSYIWGTNARNFSSGIIDLLDGVTVEYENIQQNNFTNFSLNSDLISVKLVGPITESLEEITSLTYNYTNSESLSIPYYRGYATDDQTVSLTYNFVINRIDLMSYVINVVNTNTNTIMYNSEIKTNMFINSQSTIIFNNDINSIGSTVTSLFSRLPASMLTNNQKSMPIIINSDSVTITRNTLSGLTSDTVALQAFKLYTFINGEVLKVLNLRAKDSNINDFYMLAYSKANTFVFYNNIYIGNPEDLTNEEWGEAISDVDFSTAQLGFKIDQNGLNNDGFLNIGISNNTQTNSITYFIIANPQLVATQMDINGVKQIPFDTTNTEIYDDTKLITYYFPATNTNIYKPFESNVNINNVTFTKTFVKELTEYTDPSKNIDPTNFIITGSNIQIQEVTAIGTTTNGPNDDGIIFSGLISELVELSESNPYYSYINLASITNISQLNLTYTQESKQHFQTVFNDSFIKPLNNIKFNINGYFIQDGEYRLVSSITKGIQTYIYDMIQQETSIILLKYECLNMDFTNIPSDIAIHQLNFVPTKVYTTTVTMPAHQFGGKYLDAFNSITINNFQREEFYDSMDSFIGYGNNLVWQEITQTDLAIALLNNFSLSISAVNSAGLHDMIELLYATSDIPRNFTVINQKNVLEILAPDGTPKFVITPFGQILTPNINTNALTFFNTPVNSNSDLMRSNTNIFNQ